MRLIDHLIESVIVSSGGVLRQRGSLAITAAGLKEYNPAAA